MSWQNQYQHGTGPYGGDSDPYMMAATWGSAAQPSDGDIHDASFLSSGTTRDSEELARRKAEHLESAEHIAPQHSYPGMPMHHKKCDHLPTLHPPLWISWPLLTKKKKTIADTRARPSRITEKILREHFHL